MHPSSQWMAIYLSWGSGGNTCAQILRVYGHVGPEISAELFNENKSCLNCLFPVA